MIPLYDDQPNRRPPVVTIALIALNVLVFTMWQEPNGIAATTEFAGFVPEEFTYHQPGAMTHLFTSIFMHGGWMHLIGNMWFLWIFGKRIEDICGHFRFLCFYLLCGAAATLAYALINADSTIPLIGASGAISGVLGAYLLKFPRAMIRALVPLWVFARILDVPAYLFLLFWIGLQIYQNASSRAAHMTGGVAHMAHIGGFIAGIILIFIFQDTQQGTPEYGDNW